MDNSDAADRRRAARGAGIVAILPGRSRLSACCRRWIARHRFSVTPVVSIIPLISLSPVGMKVAAVFECRWPKRCVWDQPAGYPPPRQFRIASGYHRGVSIISSEMTAGIIRELALQIGRFLLMPDAAGNSAASTPSDR